MKSKDRPTLSKPKRWEGMMYKPALESTATESNTQPIRVKSSSRPRETRQHWPFSSRERSPYG